MNKLPSLPFVVLKVGRDKSLRNFHPWIFSGAIEGKPDVEDGSLVLVKAADGEVLASGYYNSQGSIACRVLGFGNSDPQAWLIENIQTAVARRQAWFTTSETDVMRLVNAEGDGVPGLVVDKYADVLVIQVGTRGIENLKPIIVEQLVKLCSPRVILERSNLSSRHDEGMRDSQEKIFGEDCDQVEVREANIRFYVDFKHAQKTGLFIDQRENRIFLRNWVARNSIKSLLNCFSYTAGFSLNAAVGGAVSVVSVDSSEQACVAAKRNIELNQSLSACSHQVESKDVFDYLRQSDSADKFEMIVLDPPAFAKRREHINQAARGYKELNRCGFKQVKPGGFVYTFSCSYYVDDKLFRQILFQAAQESGRQVRIIGRHLQAADHPVSMFHPEGEYLKGYLCQVG